MPHALTDRQREYLEFIREYVARNESSPRLEEIAEHFGVKAPTVHNMLRALQGKGYLYFGRDSVSGFFIRLIERAGAAEIMIEVAVAGKVDGNGEVHDFPKEHGHFATVLQGTGPDEIFALVLVEDIPEASMLANDLVIFDRGKKPQPGDICIAPLGEPYGDRLFLIRIDSLTYDKETWTPETRQEYPVPERLDKQKERQLNWYPLAMSEDPKGFFEIAEKEGLTIIFPLPSEFVVATALRLSRALAF